MRLAAVVSLELWSRGMGHHSQIPSDSAGRQRKVRGHPDMQAQCHGPHRPRGATSRPHGPRPAAPGLHHASGAVTNLKAP